MKVYLDSCALIYRIERIDPWAGHVDRVIHTADQAGAQWVVSGLTLLECRVKPLMTGQSSVLADYDLFFSSDVLTWHAMDLPTFDLATTVRAEHRLKTPDALHLAAAVRSGCDYFLTNDQRLSRAAHGMAPDRLKVLALDDPDEILRVLT